MAYKRKRRLEKNYHRPRPLSPAVEKSKYREFLLDADYNRPDVPAENILHALFITKEKAPELTEREVMLCLLFERYTFFTIKHIAELNFRAKETLEIAIGTVRRHFYAMANAGVLYKVVRNWDLDDAEYKQRFGNDVNRHNYRRRYGLTVRGREICDIFYEAVARE